MGAGILVLLVGVALLLAWRFQRPSRLVADASAGQNLQQDTLLEWLRAADDRTLVVLACAGNDPAFEELVRRKQGMVRGLLRRCPPIRLRITNQS